MSVAERDRLLKAAISVETASPSSRRYAFRRGGRGLEFFDIKRTRQLGEDHEFHGHPAEWVPAMVLRAFRDRGDLSPAEYRELVQDFGSPP